MTRLLCLFTILTVTSFGQIDSMENQGGTFQALKQVEGGYNIGDWDGSTILDSTGKVLTTVSIKANMLDFSRPPGHSRSDLLVTLYKAGARRVNVTMEHFLLLDPNGHIGPSPSQSGLFQALKESDAGYDVSDFSGATLLDPKGRVLATVVLRDEKGELSLDPQQSLETLYDLGLRSFLTEPGKKWTLVKDNLGKVTLREP